MACTITENTHAGVKLIKFAWTSDAAGAATGTTTYCYDGLIQTVVTVPGTVADKPTDDYDIVLTDNNSIDQLFGYGANRDQTATETITRGWISATVATTLGSVTSSKLTLTVANAGDTKSGTVYVWIR